MIYANKLKELREEKELNQSDLANILEIDRVGYTQYETEYALIPTKHLNTLCEFFNISLDYVFSFTENKNYHNSNKEINKKLSGQRLKELRKENKLTQSALASILKVGQTTIAGYENGIYYIATPFLYDICKKYKISSDYLLGKIDNPKYLK
ncbi:MAG: helix-turn-helix domain-containing protein [Ruminococcus sp.]|nr:helix-turn-helix domain-containing protein [Ruminococcus sp.]